MISDRVKIVILGVTISLVSESGFAGVSGSDYLYIEGEVSYTPYPNYFENILFYSGEKGALRFGWTDDMPFYLVGSANIGFNSFAFGQGARAIGGFSLASGQYSDADGAYSWASGVGSNTTLEYSRAHGYHSQAVGKGATAFGYAPVASGDFSTALNRNARATEIGAFSGGYYSQANHPYSTTFGFHTYSYNDHQFVIGKYNDYRVWRHADYNGDGVVDTDPALALFVVGNGDIEYGDDSVTADNSNAFIVYEDGSARAWGDLVAEGKMYAQGDLYVGGQIHGQLAGIQSIGEGQSTVSEGGEIQFAPTLANGTRYFIDSYNAGGTDVNVLRFRASGAGSFEMLPTGDVGFFHNVSIDGNLGIGTTSPERILQVGHTSGADIDGIIRFAHRSGANFRKWDVGTGDGTVFGHNDNFGFRDLGGSGVTALVLERDTGDVGIGNNNPEAKLHVSGDTIIEGQLTQVTVPARGGIGMGGFN